MVKNIAPRLTCLLFAASILLLVISLVNEPSSNWLTPATAAVFSGSPLPPAGLSRTLSGSPLPAPTPPGPSYLAASGSPLPPPTPPGPSFMALSGSSLPAPTPGPSFAV